MVELDAVISKHGYHRLEVKAIVQETDDTRSFVFAVPDDLQEAFRYRPGQFCSFRMHLGDDEHARCYSMSSAPETDADLAVTVKRVPGGIVSNWFNDQVSVGDVLEVTRPAGSFCVQERERPIIGFCGGSGVTPVLSIAKSVLASTSRSVHLLVANRDRDAIIFDEVLAGLRQSHGEQLELRHHLDADGGFLEPTDIVEFVDGRTDADFYICGPTPFMDLVEKTLFDLGVAPDAIFIERFGGTGSSTVEADDEPSAGEVETSADVPASIVLILKGKKHEIPYKAGDTVLETARRANVSTPYSCEAGNCATCMGLVREGSGQMRVNDALEDDEVEEGWVLTCQTRPTSPTFTVEFEPL